MWYENMVYSLYMGATSATTAAALAAAAGEECSWNVLGQLAQL